MSSLHSARRRSVSILPPRLARWCGSPQCPAERSESARRPDHRELRLSGQSLERPLEPERVALAFAPAGGEELKRATPARVARAATRVVLGDARWDVQGDAYIDRLIRASCHVHEPVGHEASLLWHLNHCAFLDGRPGLTTARGQT